MKKNYLFSLILVNSIAFSQTIITKSANDFIVGNTINSRNYSGTVDNSSSGSNVIFNNNSLTNGTSIISSVASPDAAEISGFPGTNVKVDEGNGNIIYYKSSATQLEITGANISGALLNFSGDNALFLKFPTAFSNNYTDTAKGIFTSAIASGLFKGNITSTADATGTLLLGSQSFSNILRIKTVQNYNLYQSNDTFYLLPIGTLMSTIYTYYDNLNRYPIFTSTTATIAVPLLNINQSSSFAVGQVSPILSNDNFSLKNEIKVYPNPVSQNLFFTGDISNYSEIKVYNLEGKLVKSGKASTGKINVEKLSAGNYILELISSQEKSKPIHFIKK